MLENLGRNTSHIARWMLCPLLLGCEPLPDLPVGEGEACEESEDCEVGLICVSDVATHQGWHDLYLYTCRIPCGDNDQCLFEETQRCHWCYSGGYPTNFCVFDECE